MIPTHLKINFFKHVLALALIVYSSYIIYQSYKIDWAITEGQVKESRKELIKSHNEKAGSYQYHFEYSYQVGDKSYSSHRYTLANQDKSKAVCKNKVGDKITIYYNSKDHSFSVVSYQVTAFIWGMLILGLIMLIHNILDHHLAKIHFDRNTTVFKIHHKLGATIATLLFAGFILTIINVSYFAYKNNCI